MTLKPGYGSLKVIGIDTRIDLPPMISY